MLVSMDIKEIAWARKMARSGRGRDLREAASLSLTEVALTLGVTPAALSRWERNERIPRTEAAVRYAAVLRGLLADA